MLEKVCYYLFATIFYYYSFLKIYSTVLKSLFITSKLIIFKGVNDDFYVFKITTSCLVDYIVLYTLTTFKRNIFAKEN